LFHFDMFCHTYRLRLIKHVDFLKISGMQSVNINSMGFFGINLIRLYGHLIFMCTIDINQIVQSRNCYLCRFTIFVRYLPSGYSDAK
jgi:hypothetical protein